MKRIAIIGAGISGLTCAKYLNEEKFEITIFDKSRGKGGRASTRRSGSYHFDHGAQYIYDTNTIFAKTLQKWKENGIIQKWEGKIGEIKRKRFEETFSDKVVYVGIPKMSQISNYIFDNLKNTELSILTKIIKIHKKFNQWYLNDEKEMTYGPFDFLVITIPPVQAIELLEGYDYLIDILNKVEVSPRWAMLVGFRRKLETEFDAAFVSDRNKNMSIRWIARDNSKPNRPINESWVIHATKQWSIRNLERKPERVANALLEDFLDLVNEHNLEPKYCQAHRWRYALVDKPIGENFILDNNRNIGLAGDFCMGNNIENAYLSGQALGERLNQLRI